MMTLRPSRFALAILLGVAAGASAAWGGQSPPAAAPGGAAVGSPAPADPVQECLADLKAANVQFRALGAVTKDGCLVEGAVELDAVPSLFGTVSAPAKPTLACAFARQFATWVRDVAAPLTLGPDVNAPE